MGMIYLGADHQGWRLKEKIKGWLSEDNYQWEDLGNKEYQEDDDYPDWAKKVGERVVKEKGKGILICGSGMGMSIAANKVKGVRAGLCTNEKQCRLAREDTEINILCLAAEIVSEEENKRILEVFLETVFSPTERHMRRINKIRKYEAT